MSSVGDAPNGSVRADTMSLLGRIAEGAIDPGYASAQRSPAPVGSRLSRNAVFAVALLLLGALCSAAVLQARLGATGVERARTDLLAKVEAATSATDQLARDNDAARQDVEQLRSSALQSTEAGRRIDAQLAELGLAAGTVVLQGPGMTVTLTDGPPARTAPGQPDLARVLDRDVQRAVNGLFASGAEAVSVNGQRITSISPIRGAGGAVLVGYRPLTPPYTITALGDPDRLAATFNASTDGAALLALAQTYGIGFEVSTDDNLDVPAVDAVTLRYARAKGDQ